MVDSDFSRVVTYINIKLLSLHFLLQKDILNHRDILLISFFNNNKLFFLMNVYSDSSQLALKYLKNTEINIWNLLIMTRDFNIRDNLWDPLYPHYSSLSDNLFIIADYFNLGLSVPTNWVLSRSLMVDFIFTFSFHFILFLFLSFLFLERLGLGFVCHAVTSVTSWWCSHKTDHKTWENLVEDSRTDDVIWHEHYMLASWTIHGCLG